MKPGSDLNFRVGIAQGHAGNVQRASVALKFEGREADVCSGLPRRPLLQKLATSHQRPVLPSVLDDLFVNDTALVDALQTLLGTLAADRPETRADLPGVQVAEELDRRLFCLQCLFDGPVLVKGHFELEVMRPVLDPSVAGTSVNQRGSKQSCV